MNIIDYFTNIYGGKTNHVPSSTLDILVDGRHKDFKPFKSFIIKNGVKARTCYKVEDYSDDKNRIDLLDEYFRGCIVPNKMYSISPQRIAKQISGLMKKHYYCSCIFKTDIKKFYESIDHKILLSKIQALGGDPLLSDHIKSFLKSYIDSKNDDIPIGLPMGINLTQILSEFYLLEFEKDFKSYCSRNDIYYYRYVDDFILLANNTSGNKNDEITSKFKNDIRTKLYLSLNQSKERNYTLKNKFSFLGYEFERQHLVQNNLRINNRMINSMKGKVTSRILNAIKYIKKYIKEGDEHKAGMLYHYSLVQLNRIIKGTNNNFNYASDCKDIISYGIAPIFSVVNDFEQLNDFERWLGSINNYYRMTILSIYKNNVDIKLESLKNWSFKYKKNFLRTCLSSYIKESGSDYEHFYIGKKYEKNFDQQLVFDFKDLIKSNIQVNKKVINNVINGTYNHVDVDKNELIDNIKNDDYEEDYGSYSDDYLDYDDISSDPDLVEWWSENRRPVSDYDYDGY